MCGTLESELKKNLSEIAKKRERQQASEFMD